MAGWAGLALLTLVGGTAVLAPWLAPFDPDLVTGPPFESPSPVNPLGTNDIGQDILSELIWGARVSLLIGIVAGIGSALIGTLLGAIAGYRGGAADAVVMRSVDVLLVVPFLPLMIVIAAYAGASSITLIVVITGLLWVVPARIVRGAVLAERQKEYVLASRVLGASDGHILRWAVLPGIASVAAGQFILVASDAILLESALAFLGLGDPTTKSWGSILYFAQARGAFLSDAWLWWVLPAGILIAATVMGFALLGLAVEHRTEPRLRGR